MVSFLEIRNKTLIIINRFYIIIAVFLVIAILTLGYLLTFNKEYNKIKSLGTVDYQKKINELESKKSNLAQIEKVYDSYKKISQEEIKKLSIMLPPEKDVPSLFIEMEALAKESGLALNSIDVAQAGAVSITAGVAEGSATLNIKKLNINLKIQGIDSYDRLKLFLGNVEKSIRILDLNSLSYSPAQDSYSISLVTYYQGSE